MCVVRWVRVQKKRYDVRQGDARVKLAVNTMMTGGGALLKRE